MNLLSSIVLSVLLSVTTVSAWDGENAPAAMSDMWTINPALDSLTGAVNMTSEEQGFAPFMSYDKNYGFDFTYNVTNFVQPGQASMAIYTTGCRSGGGKLIDTDGDSITPGLNGDDPATTLGMNIGFKINEVTADVDNSLDPPVTNMMLVRPVSEITWKVTLDPLNFNDNDDIFSQESEKISAISFCLIFSLETTSGTEVNFQETEMVLNVDLQDPDASFNLDIDLAAKGKTTTGSDVSYTPRAYVCTSANGAAEGKSFVQGEVIDICIRPDDASQLQGGTGLVMNDVSELRFTLVGDNSVTQTAIPMADSFGLAEHSQVLCLNAAYCHVQTVLLANFFAVSGDVAVNGQASLKFLNGPTGRRLNDNGGQRSLQAGDVQPTAPVDTIVGVTQSDDGPVMAIMAGATSTTLSTVAMMGSVLMTMVATTLML